MSALALAAIGAPAASAAPDPSPPGSNDFSCEPSAAHPRPVVLVHGLGATQNGNWSYMAPRLAAAGYCVFSLTYGVDPRTALFPYAPGGVVPMERSAPELAAFVDRVLEATGASKVDLVGHSEGTVMPRYYLERLGGAEKGPEARRPDAAVARDEPDRPRRPARHCRPARPLAVDCQPDRRLLRFLPAVRAGL